jgi:hypothetical protein
MQNQPLDFQWFLSNQGAGKILQAAAAFAVLHFLQRGATNTAIS